MHGHIYSKESMRGSEIIWPVLTFIRVHLECHSTHWNSNTTGWFIRWTCVMDTTDIVRDAGEDHQPLPVSMRSLRRSSDLRGHGWPRYRRSRRPLWRGSHGRRTNTSGRGSVVLADGISEPRNWSGGKEHLRCLPSSALRIRGEVLLSFHYFLVYL